MTRRRAQVGWAVVVTVLLCAVPADAHFERMVTSSRQVSLGGALVSVVDDATAAVLNPAALTQVHRWSIVTTYDRPYGLADVDEAFAAAALRVDGVGTLGFSWHHAGIRDVLTESLFTFSLGRDLIRTSEDASLSIGASVDVARVGVREVYDQTASEVTGGAGVLLRPFPAVGIAYAVRNISEPNFDLIDGGGTTTLGREHAWGLSYLWHQSVSVSYQRRRAAGVWKDHVGVEVDMGKNLDLRSGVGAGRASGGVALAWRNVSLEIGVASHQDLGSSYIVTVGYTPPKPVGAYARIP